MNPVKRLSGIGIYEIIAVLAMLAVVIFCLVQRSYFVRGYVLGASIVAYIMAFFLASFGLKKQGMGLERIFFAVAATAASRFLFEIVYHYSFPVNGREIINNLANFSTNTSEANFPLIWAVMMVLVIFTGYKYMQVTRWFWIAAGISAVLMGIWVFSGYPQWVHPGQWPIRSVLIPLIPQEYAHAPTEIAHAAITNVSLILNSLAKIAVCSLLPALFINKSGKIF